MKKAVQFTEALLEHYPDLCGRMERLGGLGGNSPDALARLPGENERFHAVMKAIYLDLHERLTGDPPSDADPGLAATLAIQTALDNAFAFGVWVAEQRLAGYPKAPPRPRDDTPHTVLPGNCDMKADCHMRLRGCGCPLPAGQTESVYKNYCAHCCSALGAKVTMLTTYVLRQACDRCHGPLTDCAMVRLEANP